MCACTYVHIRAETNIQIRSSGIHSVSLVLEYIKCIWIHFSALIPAKFFKFKGIFGIYIYNFSMK